MKISARNIFSHHSISYEVWGMYRPTDQLPIVTEKKITQNYHLRYRICQKHQKSEPKPWIFHDFIDPGQAPRSEPDGATKKSSPYGTFKISRPTQKSALEIATRSPLGHINTRMNSKNEFPAARRCAPPY